MAYPLRGRYVSGLAFRSAPDLDAPIAIGMIASLQDLGYRPPLHIAYALNSDLVRLEFKLD